MRTIKKTCPKCNRRVSAMVNRKGKILKLYCSRCGFTYINAKVMKWEKINNETTFKTGPGKL